MFPCFGVIKIDFLDKLDVKKPFVKNEFLQNISR